MLKIKDNVDLKDLEKFGFEKFKFGFSYKLCDDGDLSICVDYPSKEIYMIAYKVSSYDVYKFMDFSVLYNLIQAGLVKKV